MKTEGHLFTATTTHQPILHKCNLHTVITFCVLLDKKQPDKYEFIWLFLIQKAYLCLNEEIRFSMRAVRFFN